MIKQISSYTSWQPLEEIIVGRVYTPDYFDFITDDAVRSKLAVILEESNQDLDNLQRTIESYGAVVRRPDLPNKENWQTNQILGKKIPIPPLTPRDWQITMGDKLLRLLDVPELDGVCDGYGEENVIKSYQSSAADLMSTAVASCIVRAGTHVFFDNSQWLTTDQMHWIRDNILDDRYQVKRAVTQGHGDAVFAILKPGVILSSMHDAAIDYRQDFPGWQVFKVDDSTIQAAMSMGKFKQENFNGRWYVPGYDPDAVFTEFVDAYLSDWVGVVNETVFDVNCLVLDEQHVIFSGYNKSVFEYCRKNNIEPIICELRHKYFWDGGISCCTQDIRRRGDLENYF